MLPLVQPVKLVGLFQPGHAACWVHGVCAADGSATNVAARTMIANSLFLIL